MAVSATLLLVTVRYSRYWNLRSTVGLAAFGLLLVVLSLLISIRLDRFTWAGRARRGRRQLLNRTDPRSRLVKFALGGILLPIAALAGANLIELPDHRTPMSLAVQLSLARPETTRAEQLGNAVLRAESAVAKAQGIRALELLGSSDALEQLMRLLDADPGALQGVESQALSKALAAYGVQARARLLQRLAQVAAKDRLAAGAPSGALFDRYFSAAFEGLRSEIGTRDPDPTLRTRAEERLQVAQAELQRAIDPLEDGAERATGSGLPAFIMETFQRMDLKDDQELLAFARRMSADSGWSEAVRGQALLLIAKLGGKDDLDGLYAYLEKPSRRLRERALEAIAALQAKLSAAASSD